MWISNTDRYDGKQESTIQKSDAHPSGLPIAQLTAISDTAADICCSEDEQEIRCDRSQQRGLHDVNLLFGECEEEDHYIH